MDCISQWMFLSVSSHFSFLSDAVAVCVLTVVVVDDDDDDDDDDADDEKEEEKRRSLFVVWFKFAAHMGQWLSKYLDL